MHSDRVPVTFHIEMNFEIKTAINTISQNNTTRADIYIANIHRIKKIYAIHTIKLCFSGANRDNNKNKILMKGNN